MELLNLIRCASYGLTLVLMSASAQASAKVVTTSSAKIEPSAQEVKRGAEQAPFAAYPLLNSEDCYKSGNHDVADLCAQWRAAHAAEIALDRSETANTIAIFGAVLSFIGTMLLAWTLSESRKSSKAAISAANSAMESLHSDRAWLTSDGLTWITAINSTALMPDKTTIFVKNTILFQVKWKNFGRTPAINSGIFVEYMIWPDGEDEPKFAPHEARIGESVISPGVDGISSSQAFLSDEEASLFREKKCQVKVRSVATYNDIFSTIERKSYVEYTLHHRGKRKLPDGHIVDDIEVMVSRSSAD